jgi:hypothetical protein
MFLHVDKIIKMVFKMDTRKLILLGILVVSCFIFLVTVLVFV